MPFDVGQYTTSRLKKLPLDSSCRYIMPISFWII